MSQAQLGELVGRSASSIRSWERDVSTPTDPAVLNALSAILDIDGRTLFDKAGVSVPEEESHPTVEEALASLAPLPLEEPLETDVTADPVVADEHARDEQTTPPPIAPDADYELEAEVHEQVEDPSVEPGAHEELPGREQGVAAETFSLPQEVANREEPVVEGRTDGTTTPPGFRSPPEPYVITAPVPPIVEPSYMEDANQKQLYRVRNLATAVLIVVLFIVLLWSLSNTIDAIGDWWNDFIGTLRL